MMMSDCRPVVDTEWSGVEDRTIVARTPTMQQYLPSTQHTIPPLLHTTHQQLTIREDDM